MSKQQNTKIFYEACLDFCKKLDWSSKCSGDTLASHSIRKDDRAELVINDGDFSTGHIVWAKLNEDSNSFWPAMVKVFYLFNFIR